jgi:hypothetical protein
MEWRVQVLATEFLALLQSSRNSGASESSEAVVRIAHRCGRTFLTSQLDNKGTTLNRVDEDVTRLEVCVRAPGSEELDNTTTLNAVILWVDIDPSNFADRGAGRVRGDGGQVKDAQTSTIVGLVYEAINDVLVVVDGLDLGLV